MDSYLIFAASLYVLAYGSYLLLSRGLGHRAQYLQLRRFLPCALLAVLPAYLGSLPLTAPAFLACLGVGTAWLFTYPLFYFLSNRKASPDFGFHLDFVFGLYTVGWLSGLVILLRQTPLPSAVAVIFSSILEFILLVIPLIQSFYYAVYNSCINDTALILLRKTYANESIEFFKSLPFYIPLAAVVVPVILFSLIVKANFTYLTPDSLPLAHLMLLTAITLFLTVYLWKRRQGVFIRTGIVELWRDVDEYLSETALYKENLQKRLAELQVKLKRPLDGTPASFIFIIGESASRDYMSAFTDFAGKNSTPWLKAMSKCKNFLLFPNAYATEGNTEKVLKLALTEANQYNEKKFHESCSIIDIARKAGYKTYWFSNQGNIGNASTGVTLVGETADKSQWIKQNLRQYQLDSSLLPLLASVDPQENNFIVFHLKGSHFNFINRYPQKFAHFSKPNKYDLIPNYLDSLRYSDYIISQISNYAEQHLNLKLLLYFSDHATIPDKRRTASYNGFSFALVRIPLFIYLSDAYIAEHPQVYNNLCANREKYWTNDLGYELICGLLDIESKHFDAGNSLASECYRYTKEMLKTQLGTIPLSAEDSAT